MSNRCLNCKERTVNCHSTCKDYKIFCAERERVKKRKRLQNANNDVDIQRAIRRQKALEK